MCRCCDVRGSSTEIFVFNFRTTGNLHPTASECKVQSSFQCWLLPRPRMGSALSLQRVPKPETAAFPTDSSDTFPSPTPLAAEICSGLSHGRSSRNFWPPTQSVCKRKARFKPHGMECRLRGRDDKRGRPVPPMRSFPRQRESTRADRIASPGPQSRTFWRFANRHGQPSRAFSGGRFTNRPYPGRYAGLTTPAPS